MMVSVGRGLKKKEQPKAYIFFREGIFHICKKKLLDREKKKSPILIYYISDTL